MKGTVFLKLYMNKNQVKNVLNQYLSLNPRYYDSESQSV